MLQTSPYNKDKCCKLYLVSITNCGATSKNLIQITKAIIIEKFSGKQPVTLLVGCVLYVT